VKPTLALRLKKRGQLREHLGDDFLGEGSFKLGFSRVPVETLDLVCEHDTRHRNARRNCDFERIPLDLAGNRTEKRESDAGVVGARRDDQGWSTPSLFVTSLSGDSVQPAMAFHKLGPESLWVFHDELDLAPGKVRVKRGGGVAGHNGLRDIKRALGTPEFWRVRIGIGHPGHKDLVTGHVLGSFAKGDQPWVEALLDALADAAPLLAGGQPEEFMTRVAFLTRREEAGQ